MIPDAEKLVGNHLRAHTAITALSARVVGKTPEDKTAPWIRLTMLEAQNDAEVTPDYLITYLLQCDCYAGKDGGQPGAQSLGRAARAALDQMKGTTLAGTAVVSQVRFSNMARIPDSDGFEPARERIILDAQVTMHEVG